MCLMVNCILFQWIHIMIIIKVTKILVHRAIAALDMLTASYIIEKV